ncbi:mitochondrial genome maintenance exonuclease 1-like [Mizuhopecten yessoensis]|uniref:Mitochondrial genome maintenance exonuclease 1 n=1 Tax=Mizuhopecten yessoensis TaxID=6573 RepID=A0A210PIE8_MIZYE|nr:mitochondrial genome maintenance exonuclease 1-like [Mizuhopecten yessoensis]XP_021340877.1 mitochondrial genome maintenance exonuclease 1-like [Mizuhopecten yessoensis]OWF36264.1 Mitochondrial genome maintenance exonuclease 1 [Mizuhopecten yessoensis]
MMAAGLFPYLRHVRASVLLHDPMIQIMWKCSPSGIHHSVCLNNVTKTLLREKSTFMPNRVKKRLNIILENKTYPGTKVAGGKGKKSKGTKDEKTQSHTVEAISKVSANINSESTLVSLQGNQNEPDETVKSKENLKPFELNKSTPSESDKSSKVAGLGFVRKCCLYSPLDQIKVNSDLNGDHMKYKKFVDGLSLSSIPSVTTIINATMPDNARYFLNRWKKQMIEELTEEGFKIHQKKTLDLGKNLHSCIQKYLNGESMDDLPLGTENKGHWSSLAHVFPDISDVRAVEVEVSHQTLLYHGKFDCVAKYRDMLCVIDWKTSKKAKPLLSNTFDNPIQVAAYLGAINSSRLSVGGEDTKIKQCALVIAYPHGDPAHVHVMDCDQVTTYWHQWLDRLEHYWVLKSNNKVPAWI